MRVQVIAACLVCDLSVHVYELFARYYQVWCIKCICTYACVYTRVGDRILQRRARNDEYVETLFPDARAHAFGRRFPKRPISLRLCISYASVLCRSISFTPRVPPDHAVIATFQSLFNFRPTLQRERAFFSLAALSPLRVYPFTILTRSYSRVYTHAQCIIRTRRCSHQNICV